jgi:hypothetical protein
LPFFSSPVYGGASVFEVKRFGELPVAMGGSGR